MFRRQRSEEPDAPMTDGVPPGMRVAGAWAWRLLAIAAVIGVVIFLVMQLALLVIPIFIAVLLAALLQPFNGWLQSVGWPKWLAVTTSMLTLIGIVTGLVWLVVSQIRDQLPALEERAVGRFDVFREWISTTFGISPDDLSAFIDESLGEVDLTDDWIVDGALSVGSTLGEVATGAILALFALLFFLLDGRRIWTFVVGLFPKRARKAVDGGATAGWLTVTNFAKVQIFVAFVDAVGIGLGAFFLQLPLALPIAVAVFLGSFIPIIGAVVTGALAIIVALIFYGPVQALIMLIIVLVVQQIEGNILQPLVMGSVVKVHPLAVVLAVAAGGFVAGIPGTLFAVPIVAFLNVSVRYVASGAWRTKPRPTMADLAAITSVDEGREQKQQKKKKKKTP